VDTLRKQLSSDAKTGVNAAERLAPAAGVWAREMLFLLRLSLRSFLTGYAEGKAEAETRDWIGIQKKIFEDAGVNTNNDDDDSGARAAAAEAAAAKVKAREKSERASRSSVVAEIKPSGTGSTLDGLQFVRKRKKADSSVKEGDPNDVTNPPKSNQNQ
jgi:hypothetical protein